MVAVRYLFYGSLAFLAVLFETDLARASLLLCLLCAGVFAPRLARPVLHLAVLISFFCLTPVRSRAPFFLQEFRLNRVYWLSGLTFLSLPMIMYGLKRIGFNLRDQHIPALTSVFVLLTGLLVYSHLEPATSTNLMFGLWLSLTSLYWVLVYDLTDLSLERVGSFWQFLLPYGLIARGFFFMPIPANATLREPQGDVLHDMQALRFSGIRLLGQAGFVIVLLNVFFFGFDLSWIGPTAKWTPWLAKGAWDFSAVLPNLTASSALSCSNAWKLLYLHFLFKFGVYWSRGTFLVGLFRLFGYKAFRNTYRLWSSRSLFEYFQNFAYYFKELLAKYFYYPCFFRLKSIDLKWRIIFALIFSIGVGNFLFHALARITVVGFRTGHVVGDDLTNALVSFAIFCVILTAGLIVSFFRNHWKATPPMRSRMGHFGNLLAIFHFYIFLQIFEMDTSANLAQITTYLRILCGV